MLKNGYGFLSTMPKSRSAVQQIYKRISTQGECSYGGFLNWVNLAVARRYK